MVFVITVCGGQQVVRQGKPFVRNFLPSDYNDHPQNWAITQGDDGLIYFANNNGVIEYDGNEFRKVSLNDVRSFGKDKTGKIYVGAENQLGFLYHDSLGQLKFKSLVEKIPEPYRKFYTILSIIHVGDEMYCFGFRSILVFKDDEFIRAWQAETDFRFGFYVYNRMFVRQSGIGLMELKNDSLMLIPGGEKFANQSVYFMLPHKDGRILMGTRSEGLYLMTNDENLKLEKFQTKFDDYLVQNTLYHGLKITDDLYVLVTNYGGVILMDSQGTLLQLFNRSSGMASNSMNYAYLDNMNNLWLASNNGIYYIELNTPITWFDEETGLKDLGVTINRIGEQLFIGTMENLFRFERNDFLGALSDRFYGFKPVEGSVDSYMDIIQFNGKLICANRSGIFEMVDNRPVLLDTSFFNYILCPSKLEKNVLFVGNGQGILKLLYFPEDNEWMSFGNFISTDGDVRDIIELDSGDLLFVEKSKHFYHARKTEHGYDILRIDSVNGLPLKEPVSMSRLYEKVILTTRGANYFYDLEKGELMSFNDLPVIIHGDTLSLGRFHTVDEKNFWVMTDKGIAKVKNGDSLELDFLPFLRIPESDPFDIYDDTSESCLWVATPKGVFCYNYMNSRDYYASFPTYLRKVVFGTDSVVSFYVTDSLYHAVDYMYNSVSFVFTSGFYESSESNEYTYFLEGFDKEWSRWSNENKATYTNLSPGEYIFTVRSRNCYKVEGEITRYSFRIIAPWYMTWWAYIIYFLLLAVLIYLIVYFNSRRLLRINEKLERIIEQRTVEINRKNSELEKQNKLITDSIRYAKHIQEAILPNADVLKKYFPDSFVYFLPRDIVSGDFYWFAKHGHKIFIAAGDCTGHGVPGSLMSMMGNTLLNEIVNEKKIYKPSEIFNQLNKSVISLLKQKEEDNYTRDDGMDISICCFNTDSNKIEIASANHRVIIVTETKRNIIEGDIYSIGGMFSSDDEEGYTNHIIELDKGTCIYMFSDGYQDQFGGSDNKKFMAGRFEELLYENARLPMDKQFAILHATFNRWKEDNKQVDDVLVLGIRF